MANQIRHEAEHVGLNHLPVIVAVLDLVDVNHDLRPGAKREVHNLRARCGVVIGGLRPRYNLDSKRRGLRYVDNRKSLKSMVVCKL